MSYGTPLRGGKCRALTDKGNGPRCTKDACSADGLCTQHQKMLDEGSPNLKLLPGTGGTGRPASTPSASGGGSGGGGRCNARTGGGSGHRCTKPTITADFGGLCTIHSKMVDKLSPVTLVDGSVIGPDNHSSDDEDDEDDDGAVAGGVGASAWAPAAAGYGGAGFGGYGGATAPSAAAGYASAAAAPSAAAGYAGAAAAVSAAGGVGRALWPSSPSSPAGGSTFGAAAASAAGGRSGVGAAPGAAGIGGAGIAASGLPAAGSASGLPAAGTVPRGGSTAPGSIAAAAAAAMGTGAGGSSGLAAGGGSGFGAPTGSIAAAAAAAMGTGAGGSSGVAAASGGGGGIAAPTGGIVGRVAGAMGAGGGGGNGGAQAPARRPDVPPPVPADGPEARWAAMRTGAAAEGRPNPSPAMDELMALTGLGSVKSAALTFYQTVQLDLERPAAARTSSKHAINFIFTGNPGTGKTTVARIFARLLQELGLREGDACEEHTGQALVDAGSAAFDDEIYQLDPKGSSQGRAITNKILAASEDLRDKLTFIVAGYKRDVEEKWLSSNAGLTARFPHIIDFPDYDEAELRSIFVGMVAASGWRLADEDGDEDGDEGADVATVAARRLARGRSSRGFANARSVRVLVEAAQRRATERIMRAREAGAASRAASGASGGAGAGAGAAGGAGAGARPLAPTGRLPPDYAVTLTRADVLGAPVDPAAMHAMRKLDAMPGLGQVKAAMKSLLRMAIENFKREERGEKVLEISLHKLFLGNPGTGKTTVASIYGEALREIGLLSDGSVEVVGASRLIGDVVGSAQAAVNALFDRCKGKVIVIDEAYVLANTTFGKQALDTLVERVQGTAGEDFACLLLGYEPEMKEMLRTCNAGLDRRFKADQAFRFEDYDDATLATIMLKQASDRGLVLAPELAAAAVTNALAKQRAKQHFGNAGAVKNLLDAAVQRLSARQEAAAAAGVDVPAAVLEASDLYDTSARDPMSALRELVNAEHIVGRIAALERLVHVRQSRGDTDAKKLLASFGGWLFAGPPGTGKTTAARAMGSVFHSLGLLPDDRVVEVKAHELIAGYVGQTAPLLKAKMDEARGGVLFIDEAYGLDYGQHGSLGGGSFKRDAVEMLLGNMTDPAYAGNMVIILAGYDDQLASLMACNPGLPRRFSERLEFHAWEPRHCVELVDHLLTKANVVLPIGCHPTLEGAFAELKRLPAYGSAGDAKTIAEKLQQICESSVPVGTGPLEPIVVQEADIATAFADVLRQRRALPVKAGGAAHVSVDFSAVADPAAMAPSAARAAAAVASAAASVTAATPAAAAASTAPARGGAGAPPGESGRAAAAGRERHAVAAAEQLPPSEEAILACLEEALVEGGYDAEMSLLIVRSRTIPKKLLDLVARKARRTVGEVRPILEAQCPALQPRLERAVAELQRQREAEEAIARAADEAEREALRAAEEERRRQGAWICAYCGRMGCPVSPVWQSWGVGDAAPPLLPYNGNNGPPFVGPPPAV